MELTSTLASKAYRIVEVLRRAGYQAYFAGGWVRDYLLGQDAVDIDIATSATPAEVTNLLSVVIPVGLKYGVVRVIEGDCSFEVATFRQDLAYQDGRHPEGVRFSGAQQDALRRDFTINGLFYDPVQRKIIDFVSGKKDLERKIIRTIGDPYQRFSEDKLRMLRAIRLASHLGFQIETETFSTIGPMAHQILEVSWERIRDELLKMFSGSSPGRSLTLLDSSGLLESVLPEIAAMHGVEQPPEYHPEGDVFVHTLEMLKMTHHLSTILALGILLHDVGKPITFNIKERIRFDRHVDVGCMIAEETCRRLKLSVDEIEGVVGLVRHHLRFMHVRQMRESTLRRFVRMDRFDDHLELHRLDCLASHGDISNWEFCRDKRDSLSREQVAPPPLVTGRDLISLGYDPGPLFSRILRAVEDGQLEERLSTREEAIAFVTAHFPKEGR